KAAEVTAPKRVLEAPEPDEGTQARRARGAAPVPAPAALPNVDAPVAAAPLVASVGPATPTGLEAMPALVPAPARRTRERSRPAKRIVAPAAEEVMDDASEPVA